MASRSVGLHVGTARQGVRGDSRSKETSSERAKKRARQWSTRRRKKRVEPQWHILRVAEGKEEEALKNAEVAARKAGEDDVEGALPEELPAGYVALRVRAKPRVVEVVTAARCVLTMVEGSGSGWSAEGGAPRPPGSDPGAKGISKGGRTLERRARKLRSDAIRDGEPMTLKEARKKAAEELQEEAMSEDASARQGFSSLREIFQQGAGAQSSSRSQSKVKRSYDADKQAPFSNNDDPETIKARIPILLSFHSAELRDLLLRDGIPADTGGAAQGVRGASKGGRAKERGLCPRPEAAYKPRKHFPKPRQRH